MEGSETGKRDVDGRSMPSDLDLLARKQRVGEVGTGGKVL